MNKKVVWVAWVLPWFLAACGGPRGPQPISHGMSPTQVQKEILDRLKNWRTVNESITEVASRLHGVRQVFHVELLTQRTPAAFRITVTPHTGPSYQVVDNSLNTIVYQSGAKYYSVLTSDPKSWTEFRVLGTDLPNIIDASKAKSVTVNAKEVVLHMLSLVAPGITAKTTLWFNLQTNTPIRWQATWRGGSLEESPSRIQVNGSLPSSAFEFTPPSGVKPEVALTAQGTKLDMARSQVSFPIVLPPASVNLALTDVNVGTQGKSRVVLLTYDTANGTPVVVTESKASAFKPPSGVPMVSETVGAVQAHVGSLPSGGEIAALTLSKTLVVVEGPTSVVDSMVNGWGNATPSSP